MSELLRLRFVSGIIVARSFFLYKFFITNPTITIITTNGSVTPIAIHILYYSF